MIVQGLPWELWWESSALSKAYQFFLCRSRWRPPGEVSWGKMARASCTKSLIFAFPVRISVKLHPAPFTQSADKVHLLRPYSRMATTRDLYSFYVIANLMVLQSYKSCWAWPLVWSLLWSCLQGRLLWSWKNLKLHPLKLHCNHENFYFSVNQ